MAGRGMRVRAPVSYSDKDSMVPAWLKTIQPSVTDAPQQVKKFKKNKVQEQKKKTIEGSSDKENSTSHGGEAVRLKGQSSAAAEKKATNASKTVKKKSTLNKVKSSKPTATRGRNAGLTVEPISALLTFFLRLVSNLSMVS